MYLFIIIISCVQFYVRFLYDKLRVLGGYLTTLSVSRLYSLGTSCCIQTTQKEWLNENGQSNLRVGELMYTYRVY
jgi:hypothetical protein